MSDSKDTQAPEMFLRLPDVEARCGIKRAEIYNRIAAGEFPKARKYTHSRAVFWLSSEIASWQQSQLAAA